MMQQREATTERLVDLIVGLKMERKSGLLRVKRGEGLTSEEGVLIFIQGQVTQINVGRRSGAEALNWLCTWGQASYVFTSSSAGEETALSFSSMPASSPGKIATNPVLAAARLRRTDRPETEPLTGTVREVPRICVEMREATVRIERSGLSRAHRRLYLLIDGQRSLEDLERLTGKKTEEIRSTLHDLEWLGIVQIVTISAER